MTLAVNKLSKQYSNKWALRDVSFEVEGGSVIGIFGGTGSGKTTLLKAIAGKIKHNGGTVTLNGKDITTVKAKERGITFHSGHDEAGFKRLFGMFGGGSSSGENQLDNFEAAIAETEKVVLLDEPFSSIDPRLREACYTAVRKTAKQRSRVVIFASSDFEQIMELTDEVAYLTDGEITQSGTPQDIYDEPASVAAARMTGDNNLIVARRVSSTDADLPEFHSIEGGHRIFAQSVAKKKLAPLDQNMTLAIRPELITMSPGTSAAEDNLLKGVITNIKFRGPTSLIEFDAGGLKIETRVFKTAGINIGDQYMLGLPPHRIIILKD